MRCSIPYLDLPLPFSGREHNGNVTERPAGFFKTKVADKIHELSVVASIEYRIIVTLPVQLNDVVHFHLDPAFRKRLGTVATSLFVLAEQHMAFYPLQIRKR